MNDAVRTLLADLDDTPDDSPFTLATGQHPRYQPPPEAFCEGHPDEATLDKELVIDPTGKPRQAGAVAAYGAETPWVAEKRQLAEQHLWYFATAILGRDYLTLKCHEPVCRWLQTCPPRRKLLLMPREHGKTSIVTHALPIHILIQPKARNLYFPNEAGLDQRVILMAETEKRGKDGLRVVQTNLESNPKIRAFWPHAVWDNPRAQSKKWNDVELILPRDNEYPDPSLRCVGVGGAITGAHPSVLIKDDLVTFDAMNSTTVMNEAIEYHKTTRALIGKPSCLEFIIGTRWAVFDLYSEIMDHDPTVESKVLSMVENGRALWPEEFPLDRIPQLQGEHGTMFPLFYLNSAADPQLVDFDMRLVRSYVAAHEAGTDWFTFAPDERDALLFDRQQAPRPVAAGTDTRLWGTPLTPETYDLMTERTTFLRSVRAV